LKYIESEHLRPGDILPSETSLADSFGVSRPVIREALKNLEGKGVLDIINGKGALIRPIDSDPLRLFFQRAMQMEQSTILELMELRRGLEVQAAVLAAQRRTDKDLQGIAAIVQSMRENMSDLDRYAELDVELHLCIAAASHNSMLAYLVESIRDSLHNSINAGFKSRGAALQLDPIQHTHELLYQTLVDGNVDAAMHAMEQHFDEAIASMEHPQV
jgi:DNA-binding FadR family transcriptional regulator